MKLFVLIYLFLITVAFAKSSHTIKVGIIDTGLRTDSPAFSHLCKSGHKDFTGTSLYDYNGHGTAVADLIVRNAGDSNYCLLIYKYYLDSDTGHQNLLNEVNAMKEAIRNGAKIINFSGGGAIPNDDEEAVIRNNPDVTFIVAAGNEGHDIAKEQYKYFPASYELFNEKIVGALNNLGYPASFSNYSSDLENFFWQPGVDLTIDNSSEKYNGTSFSTAIQTGLEIRNLNVSK